MVSFVHLVPLLAALMTVKAQHETDSTAPDSAADETHNNYSCSPSNILTFASTLPNNDSCIGGFIVSYQTDGPTLDSKEGKNNLTNFCKPDCAGKIITWLNTTNETCKDTAQATDIELSCYQNDTTNYCRQVFPEAIYYWQCLTVQDFC